jgi:hypothetical protein
VRSSPECVCGVAKYTRLDPELKRKFEALRRLRSLRETEILDGLIRHWLLQNEPSATPSTTTTRPSVPVLVSSGRRPAETRPPSRGRLQ